MSSNYRPGIGDYFPKTKRGHGSTHTEPTTRLNKAGKSINPTPCVNETCTLNRTQRNDDGDKKSKQRGEAHIDEYANVADWKAERRYGKDTPLEECR